MNRHKDQHVACGMYMNGRRGPWEAYERNLPPEIHSPGERNTQHIERKHLTLRARIKRLVRETICFSKSIG